MTSITGRTDGRRRLTDEDRARIEELAERGLTAGRIAQVVQRHASTVYWYMLSHGLASPKVAPPPNKPAVYSRKGRLVRHYSRDEDAFIQALRCQGFTFNKIAELTSKRFGTERNAHSVRIRVIMLAARDDTA